MNCGVLTRWWKPDHQKNSLVKTDNFTYKSDTCSLVQEREITEKRLDLISLGESIDLESKNNRSSRDLTLWNGTEAEKRTDLKLLTVPKAPYQRGPLESVAISQRVKPLNPKALNPCEKFKCLYWSGSRRTLLPLASSFYLLHRESSSESADRQKLQQRLRSRLTIILRGFHSCDHWANS